MKILRAYIDEPKPESCNDCKLHGGDQYNGVYCQLGYYMHSDCPLIYAPSRSMQRRLDDQMLLEEE